jgi:integrase
MWPVTFEFWSRQWLAECAWALPRTEPIYRGHLRHLLKHLGRRAVWDVTPASLSNVFRVALDEGLSRNRMVEVFYTGRRCFGSAVDRGIIDSNPFAGLPIPRRERRERPILDAEQLQRLLACWRLATNGAVVVVAATTGLRGGELLALTWDDVSFERGSIAVSKTLHYTSGGWQIGSPKTAAGRRTVWLPGWACDVLREHQKCVFTPEIGVSRGHRRPETRPKPRDTTAATSEPWVFPAPRIGGLWRTDGPKRTLNSMTLIAGLPHVPFHTLRHSFATLAVGGGVDIYSVSRVLGHTDAGFTLRTYGHAMPSLQVVAHQVGAALKPPS